jgi:hypothetical protein
MSDENDIEDKESEIIVEVDGEEASAGGAGEPRVPSVDEAMKELKVQLDQERARREELERQNRELAQREHIARSEKDDSDIQLVSNAIDTLSRETEILKAGYAQAMQSGDFRRAAEIQEEMGGNAAKLLQLTNGLEAMKAKPKTPPPQPVPSDPVEAFARTLSPRSAEWVRAHPEFVRDANKNRKMIAAHELAVADGHAPDTDSYFAAVEETLKIKAQPKAAVAEEDATGGAAKVVQRRDAAPAAAPVSRGQPSRNVVRLTAAEREMAEMMNMKPEEYAKHKVALQKEGKLQ